MNSRGFTLIELMIVVVVIGILAAIAFPTYTAQIQKSRRTDARTSLLALQQLQEKLRANCNTYGQDLDPTLTVGGTVVSFDCDPGAAATTSLRFSGTSTEGWYTIAVTSANAVGYVVRATAQGKQAGDTECKYIRLTVNADNPNGIWSASKDDPATVANDTTDQCT